MLFFDTMTGKTSDELLGLEFFENTEVISIRPTCHYS